jgi:2'-hydroxyisoflavone reductase
MRVLVMGGTRFMGPAVIAHLEKRGHEVTAFNRGTRDDVETGDSRQWHGDRNEPDALAPLADEGFDTVVDMSAYLRSQTELLLEVLPDVDRWVHISSGAVYEPQRMLPWTETTPYGPWSVWGNYAIEKLGCELSLRERRPDDLATVCLRFPYVLGPANYAPREEFVFNRLLDGEEIILPGHGKAVLQFLSIHEVGEAVANAVDMAAPGFEPYNIANHGFASLESFVLMCAAVAGVEPRIRLGPALPEPFDPYGSTFPFPNEDYVLDVTKSWYHGIAPAERGLEQTLVEAYEALVADPERRKWQRNEAELKVLAKAGS